MIYKLITFILIGSGIAQSGFMGTYFSRIEARNHLFEKFSNYIEDTIHCDNQIVLDLKKKDIDVSEGSNFYIERIIDGEDVVGYVYFAKELGKMDYMDFAVGLTAEGKVQEVIMLIYRESIGGEVKSKRFMKQFRKKSFKNKIRINYDFQGISGATMSSRAIGRGVKKAVNFWKITYGTATTK